MNGLWGALLVCAMLLTTQDVQSRRLGGGLSIGRSSANVFKRPATTVEAGKPSVASDAPASSNGVARSSSADTPAPMPPVARPGRTVLGGIAAGLGFAWLASRLGLGEGFGSFLLFVAVVLVGAGLLRWLMRPRVSTGTKSSGLAYSVSASSHGTAVEAQTPRAYSPKNVGNDASARPWESSLQAVDGQGDSMIGSALAGAPTWSIPAGFDSEGFLKASKTNFVNLQSAWDRSDIRSLRAMMTDEMLEQIKGQLVEREQSGGDATNLTDVVMLDAQLLGIEELDDVYMASVEFSGLIREEPSAGPSPFREVWNITRPKSGGGGWLVAGVQALQ